jgi:hypothetical protein
MEFHVLGLCALTRFCLGDFEAVKPQLGDAELTFMRLPSPDGPSHLRLASLRWTAALVDSWRGASLIALWHASQALPVYRELGSHIEQARLLLQTASIELDAPAGRLPGEPSHTHDDLIVRAWQHLDEALVQLGFESDPAADALFRLVYAKFSRASNRNEDRIALLVNIDRRFQGLRDLPGRGQAFTALGDEFSLLGERESSLVCYTIALDMLSRSDAPGLAVWPRRALLREREFSTT